eukprot:250533_1
MSTLHLVIAQLCFILTGVPMVLLYQKETYMGGNYPWSFLGSISRYTTLIYFAIIPLLIDYFTQNDKRLLQLSFIKLKYIFPIAICDVVNVCAAAYAYQAAGACIYIVIYSAVTIFTGLIRTIFLKKKLATLQWKAIIIITIGLAIVSVDSELNEFNITLVFGIFATLISALMDATMYVFSERALDIKYNKEINIIITEWEIIVSVGVIGLCVSAIYISIYSMAGEFNSFVIAPMKEDYKLIVMYWMIQGVVIAAHGVAFIYVVSLSSSVTAAVNKAVQSVLCFAAASIVFCSHHNELCFTWIMGISVVIVNIGTVLYACGKRSKTNKMENDYKQLDDFTVQ